MGNLLFESSFRNKSSFPKNQGARFSPANSLFKKMPSSQTSSQTTRKYGSYDTASILRPENKFISQRIEERIEDRLNKILISGGVIDQDQLAKVLDAIDRKNYYLAGTILSQLEQTSNPKPTQPIGYSYVQNNRNVPTQYSTHLKNNKWAHPGLEYQSPNPNVAQMQRSTHELKHSFGYDPNGQYGRLTRKDVIALDKAKLKGNVQQFNNIYSEIATRVTNDIDKDLFTLRLTCMRDAKFKEIYGLDRQTVNNILKEKNFDTRKLDNLIKANGVPRDLESFKIMLLV